MTYTAATDSIVSHRWRTFWVCSIAAAFTVLDISKVNVALPSIEHSLGANSSQLQLLVAGYTLAFGISLVPSGRLGDLKSRRNVFLAGLIGYVLFSFLCAIAPEINLLLGARFLQGLAAGVLMPQTLGFIQQLFEGPARGKAFGAFGAVIGIATAIGPTLGGFMIGLGGETDGWRLIFWMNVPLGLAILPLAFRLLPRHQERAEQTMDIPGIMLLGIATLCLMLPFVLTTGNPALDSPLRWFWLLPATAFAVAFVAWEKRYARIGKQPVLDFALLGHRSYRFGILISACFFAAIPALFLIQTVYLQDGLGLLPVYAGMVTISYALTSGVTSWLSGRWVIRWGGRLVAVGLVITAVGIGLTLVLAIVLPVEYAPFGMAAALGVAGVGGGVVISPNQTLTLSEVPLVQAGVASSFMQVMQRVGTAIGVSIASSLFYATVFAEIGVEQNVVVYHHALGLGGAACLGMLVLALIFSLFDRGNTVGKR